MTNDSRRLQALLRSDFRAFIEKVFTTLAPGQTYIPSWHVDAIAHKLEQVRRGEIRRLIINMPPRSLKSITASVALPAFALGHDPTKRIICVSYSGDLAKKHSNDFRAVLEAPWYRGLFPNTNIGPFKNTETEIELTDRGFRLATSVGGTLTGRGGDIIIIDDPLKPDDAMSEAKRTAANQWFTNTLLSRLDDKRTGAIIVVMQRVHIDDLTGFLLSQSEEWDVLTLPAIAASEIVIPGWGARTHFRKVGDALSPEREPLPVLEAMKLQIGSDSFSAQYQQEPAPPGGAMIKRAWVKTYSELPAPSQQLFTLQSWDTASKGGPNNDWSVCTTWVVCRNKRWYLIDVWRRRVDYPALKANVLLLAKDHNAKRILVEDTSAGTALVQELRMQIAGIIAVKPDGDKQSRMAVASAIFEAGQVFFPEKASWLPDLEAELFTFPGSRHDDQCDSISQALLNSRTSPWTWFSKEDWNRKRQARTCPDRATVGLSAMARVKIGPDPQDRKALDAEIARMRDLDIGELRNHWHTVFRHRAPLHLPRQLVFRILAHRLQSDRLGGMDSGCERVLDGAATPEASGKRAAELNRRSASLSPGTVLGREWRGRVQRVAVSANGFAWNGKTYPSLSKVAFAITGTRWNGPKFFGLRETQSKGAPS